MIFIYQKNYIMHEVGHTKLEIAHIMELQNGSNADKDAQRKYNFFTKSPKK